MNEIVILIEKIAYGGEGLGKHEGRVCFVDGALAGEKVRAVVIQEKKAFLRARLAEVLEPSPHRVQAPCPYYGTCGGCQYQHLSYAEELRWKEIQVREYLERSLRIDPLLVRPITGSPRDYAYRNSVTAHPVQQQLPSPAGFFSSDNRTVIPVKECLLLEAPLNQVFKIPVKSKDGSVLRLAGDGRTIGGSDNVFYEVNVGGENVVTHSASFFQANTDTAAAIGRNLRERLPSPMDTWIDLYSGVGTFTWLAAPAVPTLVFSEENPFGLQGLKKNLGLRKKLAVILEGQVEKVFPRWHKKNPVKNAAVFLDPPRKGIEDSLSSYLGEASFQKIIYLSCHLGTLARDLKIILSKGRYKVAEVFPFDMFPQTKHIEVLVYLEPLRETENQGRPS